MPCRSNMPISRILTTAGRAQGRLLLRPNTPANLPGSRPALQRLILARRMALHLLLTRVPSSKMGYNSRATHDTNKSASEDICHPIIRISKKYEWAEALGLPLHTQTCQENRPGKSLIPLPGLHRQRPLKAIPKQPWTVRHLLHHQGTPPGDKEKALSHS